MAQFLYQTIIKIHNFIYAQFICGKLPMLLFASPYFLQCKIFVANRHFSKDYEKLINCKYKRQSASTITHKLSTESDQPQPENHCSKPMNPMDAAFDVWKKKE
ncbi:hypothetical protein T12_4725 [Trichinella patagoniensis]|uniref:Uncharacterized protein n=1 Tax=Trichinella patagoniensis TaxID=990121 RepID=A0A0V1ABR7_9BILA|nr:hypothetical protein T12_4725 [Trichinella patagoniensis]